MQFVMEYYSVEHDSEWYKKVSMQAAKLPRVHAILSSVPAGTLGWAGGFEEGTYLQFHDYVQAPSDFQVCLCCLNGLSLYIGLCLA